MVETKICTKCGIEKPITNFEKVSKRAGCRDLKRKNSCKACSKKNKKTVSKQKKIISSATRRRKVFLLYRIW